MVFVVLQNKNIMGEIRKKRMEKCSELFSYELKLNASLFKLFYLH